MTGVQTCALPIFVNKIRKSSPGLLRVDASVVSPLVDASRCIVAGDIVPVTEVVGDDLLGTTVAMRGDGFASSKVSMALSPATFPPRCKCVRYIIEPLDGRVPWNTVA